MHDHRDAVGVLGADGGRGLVTRIGGHGAAVPVAAAARRAVRTKYVFAGVRHVKEAVIRAVLVVDSLQSGHGGRKRARGDEQEDGLLGRELDALADHVHELADGQVRGHEELALVHVRQRVVAFALVHDHRDAVGVLGADGGRGGLARLEVTRIGGHGAG